MKQNTNEAVIHPDQGEVDKVVSALLGDVPPDAAKNQLKQSNVKVGYGPGDIMRGIPAFGAVGGEADVNVNPMAAKSRQMLKWGLPHEFIHREQVKRMGAHGPKFIDNIVGDLLAGGAVDQEKYASIPQEQMAWAHTVVNDMRSQGMSTKRILSKLRQGSIGIAGQVFSNPEVRKRLLAYAYQYAQSEAPDV